MKKILFKIIEIFLAFIGYRYGISIEPYPNREEIIKEGSNE